MEAGHNLVSGVKVASTLSQNWPLSHKLPRLVLFIKVIIIINIKGIRHQENFYRLNFIFWIIVGCGIARFGRKGLKTTETCCGSLYLDLRVGLLE